ncbi:MAG: hypothetical protein ACI9TO_000944 [Rickettsiales bacterium]|jgi:hypothetical protein
MKNIRTVLALAVAILMLSNCATNITQPKSAPEAPKVKFSEFKNVEMKEVEIDPKFASHNANKKALKKIDENLSKELKEVFPNYKKIHLDQEFSKNKTRTLQITPYVKEIKFIGTGARIWVGAWAGNSAVLMQVSFVDSSTGEIIANPEFYRSASVFNGPFGVADRMMLVYISQNIKDYISRNK